MEAYEPASRARQWAFWTAVLFSLNPALGGVMRLANGVIPHNGWADFLVGGAINGILWPLLVFAGVYVVGRVVRARR